MADQAHVLPAAVSLRQGAVGEGGDDFRRRCRSRGTRDRAVRVRTWRRHCPALDALRSGGRLVITAQFHSTAEFDPNIIMTTEKIVTGGFAYTDEDFTEVIEAIAEGRIDPEPLINSVIALDHAVDEGIEHLLAGGRDTEVKILVTP
jgi:D-arabinose 1-dehydrogenase-like Zn-dependent alcohol dehydrogenase